MANYMVILSMIKGKSSHKLDVTTDANKSNKMRLMNEGNERNQQKQRLVKQG